MMLHLDPLDVSNVGTFKYGYRISDKNNADVSFLAQRTVSVVDTIAPVITLDNSAQLVLNITDVSNLKISDLAQVYEFKAKIKQMVM